MSCTAARTALAVGCLGLLVSLSGGPAWGQPSAEVSDRINEIYRRTREARSEEDYASIAEDCRLLGQDDRLEDVQKQYLNQLASWAHNRLGESYAERASQLGAEQPEKARQLDRQAVEQFEAALRRDPKRWKALHNRGVSYALRRQYDQAVADFTRVIELQPGYANAWFNRGEIRYERGEYAAAEADYSRALRLKPDDVGAHTSRGHARFQLGRFNEALADYDRAVELSGENAEALANRADAYRSLKRWSAAAQDYRRALEIDPRLGRAYQSAAWLLATCPDTRFRDPQQAVRAAEKAIQLDGDDNPHYLDALAAAYASAGRFEEARTALSKALARTPENERRPLEQRLRLYSERRPYRDES